MLFSEALPSAAPLLEGLPRRWAGPGGGSSLFPLWEAVGPHLPGQAERTDSGVLPPRLRSCFFCSFYWGLGGEHSVSSGITLKLLPHTGSWLESTGHHGISFFSS